jgi:hypothetical protein
MVCATKPTVYKWIARYVQSGIDGLSDRVSTGRPRKFRSRSRATSLALTRQSPPAKTGSSIGRAGRWHAASKRRGSASRTTSWPRCGGSTILHDIDKAFKLSTDPDFEEKVIDVIGLYLDPPMNAVAVDR